MSASAAGSRGPARLPLAARCYLALVILAATLLLAVWLGTWRGPIPDNLDLAALLTLLAILAQHYPLRLSPRYHVNAASTVYFAALLLLGAPAAILLVGASQLAGGLSLWLRRDPRSGQRRRGLPAVLFNAAQQLLATGLAGAVYYSALPHLTPARLDSAADLAAIPIAALTLYTVNTTAVAVMVGLQRRCSPYVVWRAGWREDLLEAAASVLLGVAAALLAARHAWAVLLLALPIALLHLALQRALAQAEARQAAEAARAEAEARRQSATDLADASAALASTLEYQATLQRVAELAVQHLAEQCSVDVSDPGGAIHRVAIARAPCEQTGECAAGAPGDNGAPDAAVRRVLRTGQAEIHTNPAATRAPAHAQSPDRTESALPQSRMIVPLVARGRTLGVLSLTSSARPYEPDDFTFAADLAGRAALAVDNARLYSEAREALAARDRFLAIAAHELRTPVAVLKAQADILRRRQTRGQLDAERLDDGLATIEQAANRFVRLTTDLLDVARLRADPLPLRRVRLDFADLVRAVFAREGTRLGLGDRLALDLRGDLPPVSADPDRLEQVLTNLLENAAKYSPDGGPIEVTLREEAEGLLLRVRDAGIGLPGGETESIFTPFGRAENAVAHQIPGVGLGLAICRDIAVRHGGRLWAESAGEGQGTTLLLWLPACEREHAGYAGANAPGEHAHHGLTVQSA